MNPSAYRRRMERIRTVPLEIVLRLHGAVPDRHDKSKWHTGQGPLSVTGSRFMNWRHGRGGGGAIDLVMHLTGLRFRDAVAWLESHAEVYHLAADHARDQLAVDHVESTPHQPLRLPSRDDRCLPRVRQYLIQHRHLSKPLLESLIQSGMCYADQRGNAVFVMVRGKPHRPVGAELRGTGPAPWRGMASGTRKDLGYFWVGDRHARLLVLCESAIDAISCYQMGGDCIAISTCGVRSNPGWLQGLIERGYDIQCGFDTDEPGEAAATAMIALYPVVKRLRPPAHDWNDALVERG